MTTHQTDGPSNGRAASVPMAKTYWGVFCRGCSEPIAFDQAPYHAGGLGSAGMKPGAIHCSAGHLYVYFPRDFRFFDTDLEITSETMERNRAAFARRNPSFKLSPAGAATEAAEGALSEAKIREVA